MWIIIEGTRRLSQVDLCTLKLLGTCRASLLPFTLYSIRGLGRRRRPLEGV